MNIPSDGFNLHVVLLKKYLRIKLGFMKQWCNSARSFSEKLSWGYWFFIHWNQNSDVGLSFEDSVQPMSDEIEK